MRILLFLPVFLLAVGSVAWVHDDVETTFEVVILESLDENTARDVVPVFEAELDARLLADRRRAHFIRAHVPPGGPLPLPQGYRLVDADLVVSFGKAAAEHGDQALRGTATPHLFAYLPRDLALSLSEVRAGEGRSPATGITGHLPRGAAFAIARQLLASRNGAPLNIGILYRANSDSSFSAMRLAAEAAASHDFVALPFSIASDADTASLLGAVGDAAAAAAASELEVDAFWLAMDAAAPLDLVVRTIETRTGHPVVYAPSEAAVAAGALMALAPEPLATAREAAALAKRLLDGAVPADLPLRAPHRVDLSLNLETADDLGIVPSHQLMELARGRLFR